MQVYLYDFLRFYCSFNNIKELKKQLIICFEPKEINIILNNLGKKVQINVIRDVGNAYENEIIINKRQRLYFDTLGIFNKNIKVIKEKIINTNLCNFIEFYFGIFADSYELYRKLREYYLNLGYSNQILQETFNDFCNNLNKQVEIKVCKINNHYIYSFTLNNFEHYEFESISEFK